MTTLEYVGHATFVLRHGDESLVVDPYPAGDFATALGLAPIDERYDYFVSSHDHVDHAGGPTLPGPPISIDEATTDTFGVDRLPSDHDEYGGRRRGGSVDLLSITVNGRRIVHASDIGRSPAHSTVEAIAGADVLIVPVGGFYTVGAAQAWEWCLRCDPKVIVPMHYRSGPTSLPLRSVDAFLTVATWPRKRAHSLDLSDSSRDRQVVVMEPTRVVTHP